MNEQRTVYEKRAEILTKKILSKIYALEYKTLEAKMNAEEGLNNLGGNIEDLNDKLKKLAEERDELEKKYRNMLEAPENEWKKISQEYEDFLEKVSVDKQEFYERAQDWLNNFGSRISDLEAKAKQSSTEARSKILEQVERLKEQRSKLEHNLSDLTKESGEQWNNLKSSVDEGLKGMKSTINKMYASFQQSGQSKAETEEESSK
jgi:uncharacterized coiled-coil DUF342 family protein